MTKLQHQFRQRFDQLAEMGLPDQDPAYSNLASEFVNSVNNEAIVNLQVALKVGYRQASKLYNEAIGLT